MRRGSASWLVAVVLAALIGAGCGPPERRVSRVAARRGVAVAVVPAQARDVTFTVEKVGVLRADKDIPLNFSLPGNFGAFLVAENTMVQADQPVARLDVSPFRSKLRESELQLEELKRNLDRVERFYRKQLATQVEFDKMQTLHDQAREQVEALRENLKKAVLRAPRRGLLAKTLVEPGTFVPPGVPVARLVTLSPLVTELEFSDAERTSIPVGTTVTLTAASHPGKVFEGRILARAPTIDPLSQLSRVEVEVANPDELLKPGAMVTTSIVTNRRRRVVTVPIDTLVYDGDDLCVFVHDREHDEARRRRVEVGRFFERSVIVENGLQPGEPVIVAGQGFVADGMTVRVVDAVARAAAASAPTTGAR